MRTTIAMFMIFMVVLLSIPLFGSGIDDRDFRDPRMRRLEMEMPTKNMEPNPATKGMKDGTTGDHENTTLIGRWANGPCKTVAVKGDTAYFGNGGYLEIVDFSEPSNPLELSKIVLPSVVQDVTISGDYAYVADNDAGLRIIDISNPLNHNEVGFFITENYAEGIAVCDNYAYVAAGDSGLYVLRIEDFQNIILEYRYTTNTWTGSVCQEGDYIYMWFDGVGLKIFDISNPPDLHIIGELSSSYLAWGLHKNGNYLYVAANYDGLRIIDISDPSNPQETGYYDTFGYASRVFTSENYAYIADGYDGLRIMDISDPSDPNEVGFYLTEGNAYGVAVSGKYAYVSDHWNGLRIIDISTPSNPDQMGFYDTGGSARGVTVSGNYAYVADYWKGMRIIDISNLNNPTEVGFFDAYGANEVSVAGDYAYLVGSGSAMGLSLRIIDISAPSNPSFVSGFSISIASGYDVFVKDSYAFVAAENAGLHIIDVSDPSDPMETGFYDTGDYAYGIAVSGDYAYVADQSDGLRIIDISDPVNPAETGFYDTGGKAYGVAVRDDYAYVADGDAGLRIIDISNPANPIETGFYDTGGYAEGVAVSGGYAYLADSNAGLRIIDTSDPANPAEVGFYDTGNYAYGVAISGNYAYVADYYDGLYIIRNDLASDLVSLSIDDTEAAPEDIISIPVVIDYGFSDIAVIQLQISYCSDLLSYVGMSSDYGLSSGDVNNLGDQINIVWVYSGTPMEVQDGDTLIVLNFEVDASATEGQTCTLDFTGDNNIGDPDENAFTLDLNGGTFTVTDETPTISLDIPELTGAPGSVAEIPIEVISGFNNVAVLELHISYDTEVLSYSGMYSDYLSSGDVNDVGGQVNIVWVYGGTPIVIADGDSLLVFEFDVVGSAGDSSPLDFVGDNNIGDPDENAFPLNLSDGTFAVTDEMPTITLDIPNVTGAPGSVVEIPIEVVSGFGNVAVLELHVSYDPDVLSYTSMSSDYLSAGDVNNVGGQLNIVWVYGGTPLNIASGDSLLVFQFEVTGSAGESSPLNFTGDNNIGDPDENAFGLNLNGGTFTVTDETPTISLDIPDTTGTSGSMAAIPIEVVSGFGNVAVIELHVSYDPDVLSYTSMSSDYLGAGDVNNVDGQLNVVWVYGGTPLNIASGDNLLVFQFEVMGSAGDSSPLNFSGENIIGDPSENPFTLDLRNGSFTVTGGEDPFPPFTPTNLSGVFQGIARIDSNYTTNCDMIAAFDDEGNCAGKANIIMDNEKSYINLTIYGDDPTSPEDEGINSGEDFFISIWDCSENEILNYPQTFNEWESTNGTPMPAYNDPNHIYDFTYASDYAFFNSGWNLISFDVGVEGISPSEIFSDLINNNNLIYVSGYNQGAVFYDPNGLPFLNTLTEMDNGYGYWVKVNQSPPIEVCGVKLAHDFYMNLRNGWNLIGYWPRLAQEPEDAYTALITANELLYVSGYNNGARFYDPNGLPFLNTLTSLENGFGYWVKVNTEIQHFTYPTVESSRSLAKATNINRNPDIIPTNQFMFVNGTVEFGDDEDHSGESIRIENRNNQTIAEIPIVNGNYLMTTPIYGDDITTEVVDGCQDGEILYFYYKDLQSNVTIDFYANMELSQVNLSFTSECKEYSLLQNYPNPFNSETRISFYLPGSSSARLIITDIRGNMIREYIYTDFRGGKHTIYWDGTDMKNQPVSSGIYFYRLQMDQRKDTKMMLLIK